MIETGNDFVWAQLVLAACAVVIAICYVLMCRWHYLDRQQRATKLLWVAAGGMVLAAVSLAGAGVYFTGGTKMPAKVAAEIEAETAFVKQRAGDFDAALHLYLKADRMGADPRRALYRAAECAYYLKDYDQSLDLCDVLAARVPSSGAAHHVRGLVFEARGDFRRAREEWDIAAAYGWVPARLKLGRV